MDPGLVVGEKPSETGAGGVPVEGKLVAGESLDHRPHAEVEPAGGDQRAHAGVEEGEAGLAAGPGFQNSGGAWGTGGFVGGVERADLQVRLAFQFLDEVAVPVQAGEQAVDGCQRDRAFVRGELGQGGVFGVGAGKDLPKRDGAGGERNGEARAGMGASQRAGHGAAVGGAGAGEEAVEPAERGGPRARLRMGTGVGREAEVGGGGDRAGRDGGRRGQSSRFGDQPGVDERGVAAGPVVAIFKASDDAELRVFDERDAVSAAEFMDLPVASIGPGVAGFLMREQAGDADRGVDSGEASGDRSGANDQRGAELAQALCELVECGLDGGPLAAGGVRARPVPGSAT